MAQLSNPAAERDHSTEVLLGLGSNTRPVAHITAGLEALRDAFGELECSAVYESAAVGFDGAPFHNLVAAIRTDRPITGLNQWLKALEDAHGRDRSQPKYSSRNLDIDILTFGDRHGWVEGVQLPRAECFRHAFVLRPLAELRPDLAIPGETRTWADLWQQLRADMQALHPVDQLYSHLTLA